MESNGRLDPEINYEDIKGMVFEDLQNKISDKDINKVLRIIQNFEPPVVLLEILMNLYLYK